MQTQAIQQTHDLTEEFSHKIMSHPIIQNNAFTQKWSQGKMSLEQVQQFTIQFSVFSNLFLIAQLKKMIKPMC